MKFNEKRYEEENTYGFNGEKIFCNKIKEEVYKVLDEMYKVCKQEEHKEIHFYFHEMGNNIDLPELLHLNFHCFIELNGQKLVIHEKDYEELEMSNEHINIVFTFTTNFYNQFNVSITNILYSKFAYNHFDIPINALIFDIPFRYNSSILSDLRWVFAQWLIDRKIKEYPYK